MSLPITAARPQTLRAIEAALRDPEHQRARASPSERPGRGHARESLYTLGTVATHQQPPARARRRARSCSRATSAASPCASRRKDGYLVAHDLRGGRAASRSMRRTRRSSRSIREVRERAAELAKKRGVPREAVEQMLAQITEPGRLADLVAGYLDVPVRRAPGAARGARDRGSPAPRADPRPAADRRAVRAGGHPVARSRRSSATASARSTCASSSRRSRRSSARATRAADKALEELKAKLDKLPLPEEARKEVDREWSRLTRVGRESMESQVIRTYLETVAELPWGTRTEEQLDVAEAARILDEDHYGLGDVKDRVLEFLAVHQLAQGRQRRTRAASCCSAGRRASARRRSRSRSLARWDASTSASRSAARATRPTSAATAARTSARCRAASSPGMKQAGSKNPVFLLDEVDKLGVSYQGDPATRAARGARPGAERHVHRSLPRRSVRSVAR